MFITGILCLHFSLLDVSTKYEMHFPHILNPPLVRIFNVYGEKIFKGLSKFYSSIFLLPTGDKVKNLNTINKIYSWLIKEKANRQSVFISSQIRKRKIYC